MAPVGDVLDADKCRFRAADVAPHRDPLQELAAALHLPEEVGSPRGTSGSRPGSGTRRSGRTHGAVTYSWWLGKITRLYRRRRLFRRRLPRGRSGRGSLHAARRKSERRNGRSYDRKRIGTSRLRYGRFNRTWACCGRRTTCRRRRRGRRRGSFRLARCRSAGRPRRGSGRAARARR